MNSKFQLSSERVLKNIIIHLLPRDVMNLSISCQSLYIVRLIISKKQRNAVTEQLDHRTCILSIALVFFSVFRFAIQTTYGKLFSTDILALTILQRHLSRLKIGKFYAIEFFYKINQNFVNWSAVTAFVFQANFPAMRTLVGCLLQTVTDFSFIVILTVVPLKTSKARTNLVNFDTYEFIKVENLSKVIAHNNVFVNTECDSDEEVCKVQELRHSVSSSSFISDVENSSKTNLLIEPSVSTSSVLTAYPFIDTACLEEPHKEENSLKEICDITDITDITPMFDFTREELQKRLQNIVKMSLKNKENDPEVIF